MNTIHTMTNAGLLVLSIGWFLVGVIVTTMVASHIVDRARRDGYHTGYRHASDIADRWR